MFDLWKEDLTEEETDQLIEKAAEEIRKRKLELPASMFLEMHRPLSFLGTQAAIVFSPFIVPFLGFEGMNNYSRLFSKVENVEKLLIRLDQPAKSGGEGASEE